VKRDNDGAEVQKEETLEEDPRGSQSGESLKEGDPGFGLTEMRKADHQEADRREDLRGLLHHSMILDGTI
jgi:hypothetical protein